MADEQGKREWYAGRPFTAHGRLVRTGGTLVVDATRIVFKPLFGLGVRKAYDVSDVVGVRPVQDVPPKLRLDLRDGSAAIFTVLVSRATPVWSADARARDEAISSIAALIEGR
jgi:hypothetical protein